MQLEIFGKDIRVSDQQKEKIEVKLGKFDRFFGDEARGEVKIQPEGDQVRAEITIKIRRHFYRAEADAPDSISAVEQAINKLERQIRKQKSRMKKQKKEYAYMRDFFANEEFAEPEAEPQMEMDIIRRKSFQIDPMTADEAIIQMEMLGHSFLLYLSEENQKVALVYKRNDGNYGLIEPEY
ncbi:MAG: ribosome-associated translation inhibitor RaiA [Saccharofermentanales bacterium]|nr:ribosome-associated translation inhibitor RaiA [Eubacteriales bacterium]MDD3611111.1 ribosome-associated translation inhibitor RaiA [Eubacteriales bacterium]HHU03526.1 ribosome-associated translation inhibitor RaiA [Fastidiosipila sp.]